MSIFEECIKPVLETVTAIGTLVALGGLWSAISKNKKDEAARAQQDLLEQCKRSLEWAYNSLMPDSSLETPLR